MRTLRYFWRDLLEVRNFWRYFRGLLLWELYGNWLPCLQTDWVTDWLTDWKTGWLADWLIDLLTSWLTYWLIDWPTDWPNCLVTDCLNDRLNDCHQLIDCLTCSLTHWQIDWLIGSITDLLLIGWLTITGCLADWLTHWPDLFTCQTNWLSRHRNINCIDWLYGKLADHLLTAWMIR